MKAVLFITAILLAANESRADRRAERIGHERRAELIRFIFCRIFAVFRKGA